MEREDLTLSLGSGIDTANFTELNAKPKEINACDGSLMMKSLLSSEGDWGVDVISSFSTRSEYNRLYIHHIREPCIRGSKCGDQRFHYPLGTRGVQSV